MPVISKPSLHRQPLTLTREILAFETINPPGNEQPLAEYMSDLLHRSGFQVNIFPMSHGRSNVVAHFAGSTSEPPLIFCGHLDTVPLGTAAWKCEPFAGQVEAGLVYGRGSSDMKAGVAAMVCAAMTYVADRKPKRGLRIVLTAGEETGCIGAAHLRSQTDLGLASGIIIAEPTNNYPALGHKGALFLNCSTEGVTAHSSMPEEGVNAIYKAARAIIKLEEFRFDIPEHPLHGSPTLNVGMIKGGMNVNSVPDRADFTIDIRSVAGMDHSALMKDLQTKLGDEVTLDPFVDLLPVATASSEPFVQLVWSTMQAKLKTRMEARSLPFFTDACILSEVCSCPIVIMGPGEPQMAHKTDEWCKIANIEEAYESYLHILAAWCS